MIKTNESLSQKFCMYFWFSFSAILFLINMSVVFNYIVPTIVCVWKRGSFRSVLHSEGSKYSVWFGSGRWGGSIGWGWWNKFSILPNKKEKRKKNYILIIPLSDWTIIHFASILEIQLFLQFWLSEVVAPLTPVSNTPVCVSGSYTLVISLSLYLMYP